MSAKKLIEISHHLASEVDQLQWVSPSHVYNPLIYAHRNHDAYLRHFGQKKGRVLMVGMNPGPWGMAQSGVPFGDVEKVSQWLGLNEPLEGPLPEQHPNYPILGMQCHRKEGSGQRLWGWAESRFGTAQRFFSKAFIWNYCPLLFIKENRNSIPEKLNKKERKALAPVCDRTLEIGR